MPGAGALGTTADRVSELLEKLTSPAIFENDASANLKGKPSEKMGRKASGLSRPVVDRAAELPGRAQIPAPSAKPASLYQDERVFFLLCTQGRNDALREGTA